MVWNACLGFYMHIRFYYLVIKNRDLHNKGKHIQLDQYLNNTKNKHLKVIDTLVQYKRDNYEFMVKFTAQRCVLFITNLFQ